MKGSVYSRDEAAKMASGGAMGGSNDDEDDDDDEEDGDDGVSSPLPRSVTAVRRSVMHAGQVKKPPPLTQPADHRRCLQLHSHTRSPRQLGSRTVTAPDHPWVLL